MEKYPKIALIGTEDIKKVLQRVVELRDQDVIQINEMNRLNSYQSGFYRSTLTKTADYAIGLNDLTVDFNATTGNITATLLASPTDGETHKLSKLDSSGNTVTINGNGLNINGSSTLVLTSQYSDVEITYIGGSGEWRACQCGSGGGGGGSPAGSNTQVQYNNGGSFGASSAFTFDNSSKQLLVAGVIYSTGTTGATPVSGAGTRFMYIPAKGGALRAGIVSGTQWDAANIGNTSFVFGRDSTASVTESIVIGSDSSNSGIDGVIIGNGNVVSSQFGVAIGSAANVSGISAILIGTGGTNSGLSAVSFGSYHSVDADYTFTAGYSCESHDPYVVNIGATNVGYGQNSVFIGNLLQSNYTGVAGDCSNSVLIGGQSTMQAPKSFGAGFGNLIDGDTTFGIGSYVKPSGFNSGVIGAGSPGFFSPNYLENPYDSSLIIGFNPDFSIMFIGGLASGNAPGQVGIATETPDLSAILDISFDPSVPQGVKFPYMDQATRDTIASPAGGLVIYNSDTGKLNLYSDFSAAWEEIQSM